MTVKDRSGERGSAGVKFGIFMAVLLIVAYAGYNYVPVAYAGASMKSDMESAVLQALAMPGGKVNPVDNVKAKLVRAAQSNDLPPDALIDVKQNGDVISAHVTYTKPVGIIPFGIYKYNYRFDQTATPTGFLLKQ